MINLLGWIDGGNKFFEIDRALHVEDDFYPRLKTLNKEQRNISYLFYFS